MTKWVLVIDAGHGGKDKGTSTLTLVEKELTLKIALEIEKQLKKISSDIEIYQTRREDIELEKEDRAIFAKDRFADFFLSVHINSVEGPEKSSGYEYWINPRLERFHYLYDVYHQEFIRFIKQVGLRDRGVRKSDKLVVLREFGGLAMLTENLFIDHPKDSALLKDATFIEGLATSHAFAIKKFFEARSNIKEYAKITNSTNEKIIVYGPVRETDGGNYINSWYFLHPGKSTPNGWNCDGIFIPRDRKLGIGPSGIVEGPAAVEYNDLKFVTITQTEDQYMENGDTFDRLYHAGEINWSIPDYSSGDLKEIVNPSYEIPY